MNTILVPLDGSALAEYVLPYIYTLAKTSNASVHLINVVTDLSTVEAESIATQGYFIGGSYVADTWERNAACFAEARRRAESYLEWLADPMRQEGLTVTTDVHFGDPVEHITEVAVNRRATLIAMATHGYSGLWRWMLGSITDKVVQHTTVPVFAVRVSAAPPLAEPPAIRRILVPLDGSELASEALPLAMMLAQQNHAEIHLLRVVAPEFELRPALAMSRVPIELQSDILPDETPWEGASEESYRRAEYTLATFADEVHEQGIGVHTHVAVGKPADIIVYEAGIQVCDVIVMATHGRGGVPRLALGSVAFSVVCQTTTPVLMYHPS
ncbi:MAG: universal stress protein [Chloroflexaceae bacterium]|nr:universal stress protein [Chloroflexaceae bacterium]NJO07016.1 universal stress protein [Chloroflexaceae bacterium]